MAEMRGAVLDDTAKSCRDERENCQCSDQRYRLMRCFANSKMTYPHREHCQHNNAHEIKQCDHSACPNHELQSSEIKVISPYREEPRVGVLLGFEESKGRCRARERCDRDDQGEHEEGEEGKMQLGGEFPEHSCCRLVLNLWDGEGE